MLAPLSPTPSGPPAVPKRKRDEVDVQTDGYEVKLNVPRLNDPRHPDASEAFNHSVLQRVLKVEADGEPLPGGHASLDVGGTAVREGPLSAITLAYDSESSTAAHPNNALETVLYDSEQGREATLGDLFSDKDGYVQLLSTEVTTALTGQPEADETFIASHASPEAYNFAAFQPSHEGLTFLLPAGRMGPYPAGIFEAKVVWDHLRPALDPHGPMWRQSTPFAWEAMPEAEGQAARHAYERLLSLRDPDLDRLDPTGSGHAREAADDYLSVTSFVGKDADLDTLTGQFARLHQALSNCGRAEETRASFEFIERGLRDATLTDREQTTLRFVNRLFETGSAEESRQFLLLPPEHVPTMERGERQVVINGIAVPVKGGHAWKQ